jgi:hypothetical protein
VKRGYFASEGDGRFDEGHPVSGPGRGECKFDPAECCSRDHKVGFGLHREASAADYDPVPDSSHVNAV